MKNIEKVVEEMEQRILCCIPHLDNPGIIALYEMLFGPDDITREIENEPN